MKHTRKTTGAALLLTAMLLTGLTACAKDGAAVTQTAAESGTQTVTESGTQTGKKNTSQSENRQQSGDTQDAAEGAPVSVNYSSDPTGVIDTASLFTDRDLLQTPDLSDAQTLTAADGETLRITAAGTYILSGTATDCTVQIEADKSDKVQLVLDGVQITNRDFPAVYVVSADKVFLTATGKENQLTVTGSFRADGETNTDAVIFSKDDLVLNGTGSLTVVSAEGNGITCKDDLKVTGGSYTVTSALDAIEANDSISVCGGSFRISSQKDGLHCENSSDDTAGWIYIADGSFEIGARSDGIQGTTYVQIDGGSFEIESAEGIEATYVQINSGDITIDASDDGINATRKSTACEPVIEFNGGNTVITMGQGDTDAVDANGSIYVNGGTITITAPTSSFDYDGKAELNGGTVIINGQQVTEIPQSMMGGRGGGFGGQGRGGFGGMTGQDGQNGGGYSGRGNRGGTGMNGQTNNFA